MPRTEPKPVKRIVARNLEDFFEQVDGLPEQPVGDGSCQLVKKRTGRRVVALCQGSCPERGRCFTRLAVGPGDRIRIWCECL